MATSQNGWPVFTSGSDPGLTAIPKVIGRVRKGDVAVIMAYIVDRFDREVEDVDAGRDDWGYAYRAIRGQTSGYSNHASATAIDLNATQHPRGVRNTFTAAQKRKVHAMLEDLEGVVRWGEDYTLGQIDGMHFEIDAGPAAVKRVADKIRSGKLGTHTPDEDYSGTYIERIQSMLKDLDYYTGKIDGSKGPATTAAIREFQKDAGLKVDGEPGPTTHDTLKEATMPFNESDKKFLRDLAANHPQVRDTDPKKPIRGPLATERLLVLAREAREYNRKHTVTLAAIQKALGQKVDTKALARELAAEMDDDVSAAVKKALSDLPNRDAAEVAQAVVANLAEVLGSTVKEG